MQMVLVWSWNEPRMVLMFKLWMMATIRSWCTKSIVDLIEQWFLSLCEPCCDQNIQPDVFSKVSWASWSVEPCLSSLLKPYGYTSFGLGSFRFVVFLSRAGSLNSSPNLFKLYQFFWKTKEEMADRQMSPFYLFLTLSYFWTAKLSLLSKMEAQKTWYCNFGSDYDEIMIFFLEFVPEFLLRKTETEAVSRICFANPT